MSWFYERNGIRHDNVSEGDIAQRIRQGELTASSLVWQAGMAEWKPLSATSLATFLSESHHPPLLPADRIPSAVVWVLAFAPVIGYLLEFFVSGVWGGMNGFSEDVVFDAAAGGQFWYVTLLLNILLGYLDNNRLRKAGVNTDTFGKMAWFVPVYLWQRASNLKRSPATFWVWIVAFVLTLLA